MKTGGHVIFVVADLLTKKDMLVAVERSGQRETILHTVDSSYVIQCVLVEGIIHLLDSNSNLIRLVLNIDRDGKLYVSASDTNSLQHIEQLK